MGVHINRKVILCTLVILVVLFIVSQALNGLNVGTFLSLNKINRITIENSKGTVTIDSADIIKDLVKELKKNKRKKFGLKCPEFNKVTLYFDKELIYSFGIPRDGCVDFIYNNNSQHAEMSRVLYDRLEEQMKLSNNSLEFFR